MIRANENQTNKMPISFLLYLSAESMSRTTKSLVLVIEQKRP